ncbi:MAG TPA: Lrp/AsnC family transcriptional regulator [Gammaproteobacteria bacterium]|nr:Lrp/AsnC family transcriptional regulator [Gammaproteobacteria bacterium]
MVLNETDQRLIAAIQDGLPLVSRPYAALGEQLGMEENEVVERISAMQRRGIIRRFGVVVRHRQLGFTANAMVVWDIPDSRIDQVAGRLSGQPCVSLCYQRPRRPPDWPYNLFCMIHGRSRDSVLASLEQMVNRLELEQFPHEVLFSGRCFKQRGGHYC